MSWARYYAKGKLGLTSYGVPTLPVAIWLYLCWLWKVMRDMPKPYIQLRLPLIKDGCF